MLRLEIFLVRRLMIRITISFRYSKEKPSRIIVHVESVIVKHLSRKGLHLNEPGSRHLAINFYERIKKF